ncbi:MAG: YkgJ family cysteine cluster protein [Deltaproteobacteria bacterium]|nr:YkgJ family cysteine cluster protein [Deltaproteobacteria bacterium]
MPTVTALEQLWQQVSSRPLWAPPNFRRYVLLREQMRLKLIDPKRVNILAPAGMVNDCTSCLDNCCIGRRSIVLLRLRDIATLIDLKREYLINIEKPQFTTEEVSGRIALQRQVNSDSWQTFPVLAQNRYFACKALTDTGQCSLYPNWPLACARFPYAFDLESKEAFFSHRCDSYWIRHDGRVDDHIEAMKQAAVASYNERIKDSILLAYAKDRLKELGLMRFLQL